MEDKNKSIEVICTSGKELVHKSYQLQGVFTNFARLVKPEHATYFGKTAEEIRSLGKTAQDNIVKIKSVMAKERKQMASIKKDNFTLKRKVQYLEEENSLYSFDESDLMSSQDQSLTPKGKALKTASSTITAEVEENIPAHEQAGTSQEQDRVRPRIHQKGGKRMNEEHYFNNYEENKLLTFS